MTSHANRLRGNAAMKSLRRNPGDDANSPAYIFIEPSVGYRMPRGEGLEQEGV